jgi:release factor glutamine methyltransferase
MTLAVTRDVLVPRPETELVVERALAHLAERGAQRVLDLATGSGAIALAIARERPGVPGVGDGRVERSGLRLRPRTPNGSALQTHVSKRARGTSPRAKSGST